MGWHMVLSGQGCHAMRRDAFAAAQSGHRDALDRDQDQGHEGPAAGRGHTVEVAAAGAGRPHPESLADSQWWGAAAMRVIACVFLLGMAGCSAPCTSLRVVTYSPEYQAKLAEE